MPPSTLNTGNSVRSVTVTEAESYDIIRRNGGVDEFGLVNLRVTDGGILDLSDELRTSNTVVSFTGGAITYTAGVGHDTLTGSSADDVVNAGKGNDFVYGGAGNDSLDGGIGNDGLNGGSGRNTADGGAGTDTLFLDGPLSDYIIVGTPLDFTATRISDGSVTRALNIEFIVAIDSLSPVPVTQFTGYTIYGTSGDDVLSNKFTAPGQPFASVGHDVIYGYGGDDRLNGGAGNDRLYGGDGNDALYGREGDDIVQGGLGNDIYYVDDSGDQISEADVGLAGGTDHVVAAINYTLGDFFENLTLSNGVIQGTGNSLGNKINGNSADNILSGDAGNDVIYGMDGADTIIGGAGSDKLFGGAGQDVLSGGSMADTLNGGSGADLFVFHNDTGADRISDFLSGTDRIGLGQTDFAGLLTNGITDALADGQFVLGTSAVDGDDHIIYNQVNGRIYFDVDGFGGFDQTQIASVSSGMILSASDFQIL
jgi:Ca2+-binding RTX toxin-like protein